MSPSQLHDLEEVSIKMIKTAQTNFITNTSSLRQMRQKLSQLESKLPQNNSQISDNEESATYVSANQQNNEYVNLQRKIEEVMEDERKFPEQMARLLRDRSSIFGCRLVVNTSKPGEIMKRVKVEENKNEEVEEERPRKVMRLQEVKN